MRRALGRLLPVISTAALVLAYSPAELLAQTKPAPKPPVDRTIERPDVRTFRPIPRLQQPPPECVTVVPNVEGRTVADASRSLGHEKLSLGRVTTKQADVRRETVAGQTPGARTKVRCGSRVDVVVHVPADRRPDRTDPDRVDPDRANPEPVRPCDVPDLTRMYPEYLRKELARYRLVLGRVSSKETDVTREVVIDQSPKPGRKVTCESAVDVLVAVPTPAPPVRPPPPPCVVPMLTESDVRGVSKALAGANLVLGRIERREGTRRAGTIVDQSPQPHAKVRCDSPVDVWVSTPPPPVRVPQLMGHPRSEAADLLRRAGLSLGEIRVRESNRPEGTVVEQFPVAGNDVERGTPVNVWLGIAIPTPPPPPPLPPPTPPPTQPTPPPPTPPAPTPPAPTPNPPAPPVPQPPPVEPVVPPPPVQPPPVQPTPVQPPPVQPTPVQPTPVQPTPTPTPTPTPVQPVLVEPVRPTPPPVTPVQPVPVQPTQPVEPVPPVQPPAPVQPVQPDRVSVPNVVGVTVEQADLLLIASGLRSGMVMRSRWIPTRDAIASQAPAAGTLVLRGSAVDLNVTAVASWAWLLAGTLLGLAVAGAGSLMKGRQTPHSLPELTPHPDPGVQTSDPDDDALAELELRLEPWVDKGEQVVESDDQFIVDSSWQYSPALR